MSATVGDAVDRCLSTWLLGTFSSQMNAVQTGVSGATLATEIDCQFPLTGIGTGTFVAIDDELLYVVDTDSTNNRIVVVRGARGTSPGAHIAGTPIDVNPRFPRYMVRAMFQADIQSWPRSLYNVQRYAADVSMLGTTFTIPGSINGFTARNVLKVRRKSLNVFDDRYRRIQGWESDPGLFADLTVMLDESITLDRTFAALVACDFNSDALSDDDNDLAEDVGLTAGMQEILELGAAYRLLMGRGSVRLFPEAQGQSRSAAEVGSTDIPRLGEMLLTLKNQRMAEEVDNLTRDLGFGGA